MSAEVEALAVKKAISALDTMATIWAAGFDIRQAVEAMKSLPDGTDRLIAFIKQAYAEGLFEGRTSLDEPPPAINPTGGTTPCQ